MKNFLLLMLFIANYFVGNSQYCNTATTNVAITPTTSVQFTANYSAGRRAFNFNAVAGNEYTFSTVGETSIDTYLRLYSTGTGGSVLAESDDYYNTQSEITWYCTVSGTYSVLLTRWTSTSNCANLNANVRMKYQMGSTAGSTIVTIGSGEGVVYQVPANHWYKYGWSEIIYLQSEINSVGDITKIRFQVDPTTPAPYTATNQKIYMAHTTYSQFPNVSIKENAQTNYASSNYMLVFSGSVTWNVGWIEIVLDTPFPWNNTDNLLIKYENRHGSYTWDYPGFYYTSKTATVGYNHQDASYPTTDGTRDGFRPNIKLSISEPSALPVELVDFEGENVGIKNYLFWSTFSEQNSSHFNIQKSRDGESWENIGTLNASGNSNIQVDYDFIDYNVEPIINYYRLQQYDFDGVYENFDAILIDNRKRDRILVKVVNLLGQEVNLEEATGHIILMYNDGTAETIVK